MGKNFQRREGILHSSPGPVNPFGDVPQNGDSGYGHGDNPCKYYISALFDEVFEESGWCNVP